MLVVKPRPLPAPPRLLAEWLALTGRAVTDKILAIVFPISTFIACGFEHSVANLYFIPLGIFLREQATAFGSANLNAPQLA